MKNKMNETMHDLEQQITRWMIWFIIFSMLSIYFSILLLFPPSYILVQPIGSTPVTILISNWLFVDFMSTCSTFFIAIPVVILAKIIYIESMAEKMKIILCVSEQDDDVKR